MTASPHGWIRGYLPDLPNEFVLEPVASGSASTVSLIQADGQRYFHKTCEAAFAFEPPVTVALAQWFPAIMPEIVGWDADNRWLLMGDAGENLRNLSRAEGEQVSWSRWENMLRRMAALQIGAIQHVDDLLALGLPDRRPAQLPRLYQSLIADPDNLMLGQEGGISQADAERLPTFAREVERLCALVEGYRVPQTLHHDDFHAGNIGVVGDEYRVLDWAESCIAHPFFSLMMMLRYAKFLFKADDAVLAQLTAAYLEAWTIFEPMERLLELLPLTHQLGALCRTGTWAYVMHHADATYRAENGDAVPYWLMTLVNNTPFE